MPWNHNTAYHDIVLRAVPSPCARALDVGCGHGELSRLLAPLCGDVTGLDANANCIAAASSAPVPSNLQFVHGDFLVPQFEEDHFDFIAAVASVHHMPMQAALRRCRDLLRPGGVIAIVGLFRDATPVDYLRASVALPVSKAIRLFRGGEETGVPLKMPQENLQEIRVILETALPGGVFKRRFFFRYSFLWKKPGER